MNTTTNTSTISAIFAGEFSNECILRVLSNMHFMAQAKFKSAASKALAEHSRREHALQKDAAEQLIGCDDRPSDELPQVDGVLPHETADAALTRAGEYLAVASQLFHEKAHDLTDVAETSNAIVSFEWMVKKLPSLEQQIKDIALDFSIYQGVKDAQALRADCMRPGYTQQQRQHFIAHAQELETNGRTDAYEALHAIMHSALPCPTSYERADLDDLLELAAEHGYCDKNAMQSMYQQLVFFRRATDEYIRLQEAGTRRGANMKPRIDVFVAIFGEHYEKSIEAEKAKVAKSLDKAAALRARLLGTPAVNDPAPAPALEQEEAITAADPKKGGRRVPKAD